MKLSSHFKHTKLTHSQEEAIFELDVFLSTDFHTTFLLKGFAGTGKTFITQGITQYLKANGRQFFLMAPTGKATKVIANKTQHEASTIHRIIYKYFDADEELQSELDPIDIATLKSRTIRSEDEHDAVYIIDEASMISDQFSQSDIGRFGSGYLLNDLLEYVDLDKFPNRKIIFIGDNAQLPPIRCLNSPALNLKGLELIYGLSGLEVELTDVVRQKADSGIVKNAMKIRARLHDKDSKHIQFIGNDKDVFMLSNSDFLQRYLSSCNHELEGCRTNIIIAATNRQVSYYNTLIRKHLFNSTERLNIGEQVMCISNVEVGQEFISNGEMGWIKDVSSDIEYRDIHLLDDNINALLPTTITLAFVDVTVEFIKNDNKPFQVTKKTLLNLLKSTSGSLTPDERKALLLDFKLRYRESPELSALGFSEAKAIDEYYNCLQLKYGYTITCHKAQGSEWPHVFVDNNRSNKQSEQSMRWMYTAITRATQTLYLKSE